MPKNIVVFSDGTGQEGGKGNNTNVYKLFNMVEDRTSDQLAFYDRGLGTGWRKVSGSVGGAGISKNILECYEFLFNNYNAGDQIYLFGFSRGATTVRSLSGFIHMFGILPKSRPELIKQAFKIYKTKNKKKRNRKAANFLSKHHTMWTKIQFLGVWDTVAALGLPLKPLDVILDKIPAFRHDFHDLTLSKSVIHARHALAIDDERLTFHPTLWDAEIKESQTIKQVWFCGMHTDVGGGYAEQGLSDIALLWMVKEATDNGLLIFGGNSVAVKPDPDGLMHNSRGGFFGKLYRKEPRSWDAQAHGKPVVHESVLERTLNKDNREDPPYAPWILIQTHDVES